MKEQVFGSSKVNVLSKQNEIYGLWLLTSTREVNAVLTSYPFGRNL